MSKSQLVQARIDPRLKGQVEKILDKLGISKSQLICMLFKQVKLHQGIPFPIKIPNKETIDALKETQNPNKLKKYASHDELMKDLGL